MLKIKIEKSFKKDIERLKRSGKYPSKVFNEIKEVIAKLQNKKFIDPKYKRHPLIGNLKGYEAVHIRSDLIMVYKITKTHLILAMIGKHTKVYKKFK